MRRAVKIELTEAEQATRMKWSRVCCLKVFFGLS